MSFADDCDRRPLVMVRGNSTATALIPGLRKRRKRHFGIAQFISSSCIPALNAELVDAPKYPDPDAGSIVASVNSGAEWPVVQRASRMCHKADA